MYTLEVTSHFDAAHFLRGYNGQCANLHGHTWKYTVVIQGSDLGKSGMLLDFKIIKDMMKNRVEKIYDHQCLNDLPEFMTPENPTAENIARHIYQKISEFQTAWDAKVIEVSVNESDDCKATYSEYILVKKIPDMLV